MGQGYLIDTNVAIDYFGQLLPSNAIDFINSQTAQISVATRIELLSWPDATNEETGLLTTFVQSCNVYDLTENIIIKTIEVRKNFKLKLGHAIIAATALVNDLILISRNMADFKKYLNFML